jgi:hypothetical protein
MGQLDPTAALIRRRIDAECRLCRAVVSDPEWRTLCELWGLPAYRDPGMRTCARCVRQQREANAAFTRENQRRIPSRPPIGLRVSN